jgi:hypothetical protein
MNRLIARNLLFGWEQRAESREQRGERREERGGSLGELKTADSLVVPFLAVPRINFSHGCF